MLKVFSLAVSLALVASLVTVPHAAYAVVNSTFTVTGGNPQQVAQTTISLTNITTGQTVQTTETKNSDNKKTIAFVLPDGNYHLTVTSGGKTAFQQDFRARGDGTASGGFNTDSGGAEPIHGGQIADASRGGRPGGSVRGQNSVFEFGGGMGPTIFADNTRVGFAGTGTGGGATFNEHGVDVLPTLQFWSNFRPAGWHGIYVGAALDLAVPLEGEQTRGFTTSNGIVGTARVEPRNVLFNFMGRVGVHDPILPGSVFAQFGGSVQSWKASVVAPSVGDSFTTSQTQVVPTLGLGARAPLARVFGNDSLRGWSFDGEGNYYFAGSNKMMPGGNALSFGTLQARNAFSFLLKMEYEFGCIDP